MMQNRTQPRKILTNVERRNALEETTRFAREIQEQERQRREEKSARLRQQRLEAEQQQRQL